jgi:PAS domain S-box-containing protein
VTDEPTSRPDPHAIEGGFFAPAGGGSGLTAQLADLEARYRGVIDRLPAVIYIDGAGDDDPMIDVSPGIEDLLGVTREDYLREGSDWADYIHPDDHARMVEASELSVASETEFHEEFRAVHADGRVVWVREDSVLIRDGEGKACYWLGIMLDITQLVEAKRDLHHVQSTYGALVEQIPAIVYQDKTDESWSTVYVSPQITTLLGVLPEEWTGESKLWSEMLHPDDRERAIEEVDRGIETGEPYTVEYRMIGRDGRVKWFQDTALMLRDAEGNPAFTHGVMLDITERREAEERLTYLAYHDSLTGMPNRAMFDELLELDLEVVPRDGHRTEGRCLLAQPGRRLSG